MVNIDKKSKSIALTGISSVIISLLMDISTMVIIDRTFLFPKVLMILGLSAIVYSLILIIKKITKDELKILSNKTQES